MKIQSKLTALVAITALAAGPLVLAEDAAPITPDVVVCPAITDVPDSVEAPSDAKPVDGDEDTSVIIAGPCDPAPEDVVSVDDGPVKDGGEIPLDWIKRGGENPDVIFYNMAGGPAPEVVNKGETPTALTRDLGQDDKGAVIEAKGNAMVPQVKGVKKEPVAVIKKGHVFLR